MRFFVGGIGSPRRGSLAVDAWSAALALGSVSWLAGGSSGKLFLEWSGAARVALPVAMAMLWLSLARGWLAQRRSFSGRGVVLPAGRPGGLTSPALLLALLPVPAILYWASGPGVYPPFNPDSGGATGSSLLGSSLGIVAVLAYLLVLPPLMAATIFRKFFVKMGFLRYMVLANLALFMAALPIKMALRWAFNLKYIVAIPEWFFNI